MRWQALHLEPRPRVLARGDGEPEAGRVRTLLGKPVHHLAKVSSRNSRSVSVKDIQLAKTDGVGKVDPG